MKMKYKQHKAVTYVVQHVADKAFSNAFEATLVSNATQTDCPTLDNNDNQLGMMDGKQTLMTDTGWYTP